MESWFVVFRGKGICFCVYVFVYYCVVIIKMFVKGFLFVLWFRYVVGWNFWVLVSCEEIRLYYFRVGVLSR